MIGELIGLGQRLAGQKDPRMKRGLLFAVAEAAATAVPFALMLVFLRDALSGTLTLPRTWLLTGGVLAAVLVRMVFAQRAMGDIFTAAHALMGRARIRVADHLRKLPMGFFTSRRSGELTGVLTTDIGLVEDLWSHLLGVFAAGFILPAFIGVGLMFLDWRLGLAMLVTLPLAFGALKATTPLFLRHVNEAFEASADANARIVEFAQGIAVLRTFDGQGEGYRRLAHSLEKLRDALIAAEVKPAPLLSAYGFVIEMGFALVALSGSYWMLGGSLEAPTLLVFLVVSAGVTRQLSELGVGLLSLRAAQRALQRVDALLKEKPLREPTHPAALPQRSDIQLEGVTFAYEKDPVLDGVSLSIPERQLTALVGPSGSGKSTIVHLMARLWDVDRHLGAIRIGGVDIRDLPFEALHRHIAMVFQDVVLFSGTVLENIQVGKPEATREEVIAAAKEAQAHGFISTLPKGYDTILGEGGSTLSGGERQRISIARAILKNAPIVLLDEATASIDASAESELQRAIDRLVSEKTVVVIAHRLKTIQRAHQIIVLDHGRVVEQGRHEQLLSHQGLYARMWNEQQRAKGWRLHGKTTANVVSG